MKKHLTFGLVLFLFVFSQTAFAKTEEPALFKGPSPEAFGQQMKKMQEQMEKSRKEQMEMLKKTNPQAYNDMVKQEENSKKTSKIVSDYYSQKIGYEAAKSSLYPLVKENMKGQAGSVDGEIQMLEQRLTDLKKAKSDPDYRIYQQIDGMLGKGSAMGPSFSGFLGGAGAMPTAFSQSGGKLGKGSATGPSFSGFPTGTGAMPTPDKKKKN